MEGTGEFEGYFKENKEKIKEIFPREDVVKDILDHMYINKHVLGIRGFRRIGKSTILRYLLSFFDSENFDVAYVDVESVSKNVPKEEIIEGIENAIHEKTDRYWTIKEIIEKGASLRNENLGEFVDIVYRHVDKWRSNDKIKIYVLDEVQYIALKLGKDGNTRFVEFVNELTKKDDSVFIIFTGSQVSTFNNLIDVFDEKYCYEFKRENQVIDIGQLSSDEVQSLLLQGFGDNNEKIPEEDFPKKVYNQIGGIIGYVTDTGRDVIKAMRLGWDMDKINKNIIRPNMDNVFTTIKGELWKIDQSLGLVPENFKKVRVNKSPSIFTLRYVAKHSRVQMTEMIDELAKKFPDTVDDDIAKTIINMLIQVDLMKNDRGKLETYEFIQNYNRW